MSNDLIRPVRYRQCIAEKATAYANYNAASYSLELASIRERNAELASQSFESIAKGALHMTLGNITAKEREIGLAFARYAVYGRHDQE